MLIVVLLASYFLLALVMQGSVVGTWQFHMGDGELGPLAERKTVSSDEHRNMYESFNHQFWLFGKKA
jgi:hypothetical protein